MLKDIKVNMDYSLDPDFGNIKPEEAEVYIVKSTPAGKRNGPKFIVVIPVQQHEDEAKKLIQGVMNLILNPGDKYTASRLDLEELDGNTPIISYNPIEVTDNIEFFWLFPPKSLRH